MANWCIPRVYATLDLGHRKSAVDMALAFGSGHINRKLPLTSVSGRIYAEYTAQPWFILYYIYNYILLYYYTQGQVAIHLFTPIFHCKNVEFPVLAIIGQVMCLQEI